MGNRCYIKGKDTEKGVYLHWNGGRDSVEAFLKYCELREFRPFNSSDGYGLARFCQVVGNYFGGGESIGVEAKINKDFNTDNGTYIIENWTIVGRENFEGEEQREYNLQEMLIDIDESQPVKQQLGDYLKTKEVNSKDLKLGDFVYIKSLFEDNVSVLEVIGFGDEEKVNGSNVKGVPYVSKYNVGNEKNNINNYIREEKVRVKN